MSASKRGRNNRARGGQVEREVAKLLGGYRTGSDRSGKIGDVQTLACVYEVKSRQQATPKLISGAWEQLMEAVENTEKDPGGVVLAYAPGPGKPREFWLVTRLEAE